MLVCCQFIADWGFWWFQFSGECILVYVFFLFPFKFIEKKQPTIHTLYYLVRLRIRYRWWSREYRMVLFRTWQSFSMQFDSTNRTVIKLPYKLDVGFSPDVIHFVNVPIMIVRPFHQPSLYLLALYRWHSLELNSLWLLIYWPDLCQLPLYWKLFYSYW